MQETVMYEAKNLYKRYGSRAALKGVNFSVSSGKLVGLLGPNGSGKTTPAENFGGIAHGHRRLCFDRRPATGCVHKMHYQLSAGPNGPAHRDAGCGCRGFVCRFLHGL